MSLDEEDRVRVQHPAFVINDRERRDEANKSAYTKAQHERGFKLKEAAWAAYGGRPQAYLNYQEGFMAVKVEKPKPSEKNRDEVAAFNASCLSQGIIIIEMKSGAIIYRFV